MEGPQERFCGRPVRYGTVDDLLPRTGADQAGGVSGRCASDGGAQAHTAVMNFHYGQVFNRSGEHSDA